MLIEINSWIKNEVVEPVNSLYRFLFKNIKISLSLLLIISGITFLLFPNVIFPIEKNHIQLINPKFEIKKGRMTSLILSQDNKKNRGRYRVNCAYFINLNGESFCDNFKNEKILILNGFYLEKSLFKNGGGPKSLVVESFVISEKYEGNKVNVDEIVKNKWSDKIVDVIYLIRWIGGGMYALLIFIFIRKYIFFVKN